MRKIKLFSSTREVLKNMTSPPVTVNYPEEPAIYPQRMRGHIRIDIDQCISCTLCAQNCPPRAITVDRAAGTWSIDRFDCVQCGSCVNVCPKKCLYMEQGYTPPDTKSTPKHIPAPNKSASCRRHLTTACSAGCAPANVRSRRSRSAGLTSNGKSMSRNA